MKSVDRKRLHLVGPAGLASWMLCLFPFQIADAASIPYGDPRFFELASIGVSHTTTGATIFASTETGASVLLPETVSTSYTIFLLLGIGLAGMSYPLRDRSAN